MTPTHRRLLALASVVSFVAVAGDASGATAPAPTATASSGAIFGRTTVGNEMRRLVADRKRVSRFVLPSPGSVTHLSAYLDGRGSRRASSQRVRFVLYADRGGRPGSRLGVTTPHTVARKARGRWVTLGLRDSVTLPSGTYHLGIHSGASSGVARFAAVRTQRGLRQNGDRFAGGASDPFGGSRAVDLGLSMYGAYTPVRSQAPPSLPAPPTPSPAPPPSHSPPPSPAPPPPPDETAALERWSEPATWGGQLPAEGSVVTIPAGKKVLIDTDVPRLGGVTVHGELHFHDRPTIFRSKYIVVYGKLVAGTEAAPLQSKVTISLEGETAPVSRVVAGMDVGANVMAAVGGATIDLHGRDSGRMSTKLAQTASAGDTTIHLRDPVAWQPGDRIVLSSTTMDFRHYDEATVASRSADGRAITLTAPLTYAHASVVTSFTHGPETRSVAEQGDVGLLTKNLVVTGDRDPARRFSGHTIVLPGSTMRVSNVEFAHLGQEGVLGRYPLHWHMTGNASGSYARNTSIHHSFSRFVTVHRTNNLRVDGGVWHDAMGHGFMLEDGVEVGNGVNGILALTIRRPGDGKRLRRSDDVPSAFWITHPSNDFTNLIAAGGEGAGIWYDFNFESDNRGIFDAIRRPLGRVENLEAHSHLQLWGKHFPNHAAGGGIVIEGYYGNLANGRQSIHNLNAWKNQRYGHWLDGAYTARGVYGANNGIAYNGQDTAAAGGLLVGSTANTGGEEGRLQGLIRFYHGHADVDDFWLANYDQRAGSLPEKVAITDATASSNDATNRIRNIRFIGPGYRVLFSHNSPYHNPNSVYNSHWFEDVDGSILGNGVNAVITNRQMFIRSSAETSLYPDAGKSYFQGSDFGAYSSKGGRGFARFIADHHTFSMTRLDTGETATDVSYPGVTLGVRYRINSGLPNNVNIQVRGSEPGWFELEFPDSSDPTSMSVQGGGFSRTLTRAGSLAELGKNGDYYWDGATRTLYLRIVITGTPIPFGNGGDYSTIQGDGASWRIRR